METDTTTFYDNSVEEECLNTPDCLVLEIYANHEIYEERRKVYVLYDVNERKFILRGKQDEYSDFNFKCKNTSELADFICLIFDKRSYLEVAIYNYKNLPWTSEEITFDYFYNEFDDYFDTIYTNDDFPLKAKKIRHILKMLKNIYNDY